MDSEQAILNFASCSSFAAVVASASTFIYAGKKEAKLSTHSHKDRRNDAWRIETIRARPRHMGELRVGEIRNDVGENH